MNKTFPAGVYYVGDPCYAVKDSNWDELLNTTAFFGCESDSEIDGETKSGWNTNFDEGHFEYNGKVCFASDTKYGDGCFTDNRGREYGVDAGMIAVMPLEVCDGDSMSGGQVIIFDEPFTAWAHDGKFIFGDIVIDTGDEEEDEDYYGEDEEEEYEDEEETEDESEE